MEHIDPIASCGIKSIESEKFTDCNKSIDFNKPIDSTKSEKPIDHIESGSPINSGSFNESIDSQKSSDFNEPLRSDEITSFCQPIGVSEFTGTMETADFTVPIDSGDSSDFNKPLGFNEYLSFSEPIDIPTPIGSGESIHIAAPVDLPKFTGSGESIDARESSDFNEPLGFNEYLSFSEPIDIAESINSGKFIDITVPTEPIGADTLIGFKWPMGSTGAAGSGVLIPFASGTPIVLTCLEGGLTGLPAFVGFDSNTQGHSVLGATIDLPNSCEILDDFAFQVPCSGTITSFGAYFSTVIDLSLPEGSLTVTAQLYQSAAPDDVFTPIAETNLPLSPELSGAIAIGTVLTGDLTGLSIPVAAHSRLMLVYSLWGTDEALSTVVTGCANAGLAII